MPLESIVRRTLGLLAAGLVLASVAGTPALTSAPASASTPPAGSGNVDRIWTDFGGFWDSSEAVGVKPNDEHHLLAFRLGSTIYSTGVDDARLSPISGGFVSGDWRALPVEGIPASGPTTDYLYARGAGPTENDDVTLTFDSAILSAQLTRGTRGLDLASGLANIPNTATIAFNLPSIATSAIGDGIPDILITQIAGTSLTVDTLRFVDGSNTTVGNSVALSLSSVPELAERWTPKFWIVNTGVRRTDISGDFPLRLRAFELSEFGVTSANIGSITKLLWEPSGASDPAFFAYNTQSLAAVASSVSVVTPTVTLASIADRGVADGPVATAATSSAGLTISYTTTDASVCTVDGSGIVTAVAEGTCTVEASTASQTVGSIAYSPAAAARSFTVLAAMTPAPAPSPSAAQSSPSYVAPGGVLPSMASAVAELRRADGTAVSLVSSTPSSGVVRYATEGFEVTLSGAETTSPSAGLVADAAGTVECVVCTALATGSVIEAWLFSTPRLVAAWEVAEMPCQRFIIPLGVPLDGGGAVEPGSHTLQLVLPTAQGTGAVNVAITVGGPVPTGVPSGTGVTPIVPDSALALLAVLGVVAMIVRTRSVRSHLQGRDAR